MNLKRLSYDWFQRTFSEGVYEYGPNRMKPIVRTYLGPVRGTILDAACGRRNAFWEPEFMTCTDSVGLDSDEAAICENRFHNSFLCQDVHDLADIEHYGGILSVYTWEHLQNPKKCLENFYRALRPGGILVIIAPNRWSIKSTMERVMPRPVKDLAWRMFKGHSHMLYPAFHQLCTKQSLMEASRKVGLEFVEFKSVEYPFLWFAKMPPLFLLFAYWMVLANRFSLFEGIRSEFIAVMRKPTAKLQQP